MTTTLPRIRAPNGSGPSSSGPSGPLPSTPSLRKQSLLPTTPGSKRDSLGSSPSSTQGGKLPRRAISIASFPQPPLGKRTSSFPSSPLTQTDAEGHTGGSKLKRPSLMAMGGISADSLPGAGMNNDSGFLSIPSPPPSRGSSALGSYANSTDGEVAVTDKGRPDEGKEKDQKGNVIVSVRVRPSNEQETPEWTVDGRNAVVAYRGNGGGDYKYDNVFDPADNNARVYDSCAKRLVRRVMEGYHGTVFAYGMTGTGKTFSMQGTTSQPGVIPLAVTDIFSFIRETPHREFLLRVSYLEIYNEKIHDLLSPQPVSGQLLNQQQPQEEIKLREDAKRGVYATPLKEEIVQSPTQLLRVIARGDLARRTGSTQFNARSSRSHAVVQIVVESRDRVQGQAAQGTSMVGKAGAGSGGVRVSTLSLIDLAGSERAAEDKTRRTEGAHINRSLLTLGTVIARLAKDKAQETDGKADNHLPYRDSKLTRLLQPALSGNSLISILCTISTGSQTGAGVAPGSSINETLNTLKFAARARNNIVSHAKKADDSMALDAGSRALLDRYRLEIENLRKELESQKSEKDEKEIEKELIREFREKEKDDERHNEQLLEMQLARTALKERIEHLNRLILSSKSAGVNHRASFQSSKSRSSSLFAKEGLGNNARFSTSSSTSLPGALLANSADPSIPSSPTTDSSPDDAPLQHQVASLQADLADRNRYIATLEKRLLTARRSSQSRVSQALASPVSKQGGFHWDQTSAERAMLEKDREIVELRARLEDKERMLKALREANRQRDKAESHTLSSPISASGGRNGSGMWRESVGSQLGDNNIPPLVVRKSRTAPGSPARQDSMDSLPSLPSPPQPSNPTSPTLRHQRLSILSLASDSGRSRREKRDGLRAISGIGLGIIGDGVGNRESVIGRPPEGPLPPTPPRGRRGGSRRETREIVVQGPEIGEVREERVVEAEA